MEKSLLNMVFAKVTPKWKYDIHDNFTIGSKKQSNTSTNLQVYYEGLSKNYDFIELQCNNSSKKCHSQLLDIFIQNHGMTFPEKKSTDTSEYYRLKFNYHYPKEDKSELTDKIEKKLKILSKVQPKLIKEYRASTNGVLSFYESVPIHFTTLETWFENSEDLYDYVDIVANELNIPTLTSLLIPEPRKIPFMITMINMYNKFMHPF